MKKLLLLLSLCAFISVSFAAIDPIPGPGFTHTVALISAHKATITKEKNSLYKITLSGASAHTVLYAEHDAGIDGAGRLLHLTSTDNFLNSPESPVNTFFVPTKKSKPSGETITEAKAVLTIAGKNHYIHIQDASFDSAKDIIVIRASCADTKTADPDFALASTNTTIDTPAAVSFLSNDMEYLGSVKTAKGHVAKFRAKKTKNLIYIGTDQSSEFVVAMK